MAGPKLVEFFNFFFEKSATVLLVTVFFCCRRYFFGFFFFTVAKRISRIFLPLPNRSGVFFSLGYEFSRV